MTALSNQAVVLRSLHQVAPEVDVEELAPETELLADLDLDVADFLSFVDELGELAGIEVAEGDYPELVTIESCVAYLDERRRS